MVSTIPYVSPPADAVFRVNRRGRPLFKPPDWHDVEGRERVFNGRFDDPSSATIPIEYRFRTIYCSTSRAAALGEVIAGKGLRPKLSAIAKFKETVESSSISFNPEQLKFCIWEDWRSERWIEQAKLHESLRFADMEAPETLHTLRLVPHLAKIAQELIDAHRIEGLDGSKLTDFDRSLLYGPHTLTQHIARHIFEQVDNDRRPMYDGIRYTSRLNSNWECWAVFDSRIHREIGFPEPILHDSPGLREVSILFQLPIESFGGKLICPWLKDEDCGNGK